MGEIRCSAAQCQLDCSVSMELGESIDRDRVLPGHFSREHAANSHSRIGWAQFTDGVIKILSDQRQGNRENNN